MNEQEQDKLLFELLLRHQLILERFKLYQVSEFDPVLRDAAQQLKTKLGELEYDTLREIPRRELKRLINSMRDLTVVDDYVEEQLKTFRQLSSIEAAGLSGILALFFRQGRTIDADALWEQTRNEPIAATGNLLATSLKQFRAKLIDAIEQAMRSGYAMGTSIAGVRQEIIGTSKNNYRDGLFARLKKWDTALITSVIQHTSSIATEAIFSTDYNKYQWTIDPTSNVCKDCIELNEQVFNLGEGPRPPIHYHCACFMVPIKSSGFVVPPLNEWMDAQTPEFRRSLMKPLSLGEYEDALNDLIAEGVE